MTHRSLFLSDVEFEWPVAARGYTWAEDVVEDEQTMWNHPPFRVANPLVRPVRSRRTTVLKARLPLPHSHPAKSGVECKPCLEGVRIYQPIRDYKDLFLQFSRLNPRSRKELLRFADKFGHLTERIRAADWFLDPGTELSEPVGWQLRNDFTLLLQGASGRYENSRLHRAGDEIWTEWSEESVWLWRESIVAVREVLHLAQETPPTGAKHADARRALFDLVEQNLPGRIRVMPLDGTDLAPRPVNLLGVIWLQVAAHITGQAKLKPCQHEPCGKLFRVGDEIAPKDPKSSRQHGRSSRDYCSVTCRNAAGHQNRKKKREQEERDKLGVRF